MKMLWLKTVELLRRYPVLWLPVMWAGVLSYGWTQLRHIVTRDLVGLMLRDHSALGVPVQDHSATRMVEVYLLSGFSSVLLTFADVCCYVAALLMTAKMLGRLTAPEGDTPPYADISIKTRGVRLLWVGFLAYVSWWLGAALMAFLFVHSGSIRAWWPLYLRFLPIVTELLVCLLIAYFVTPAALRLLSGWPKEAIDAEVLGTGRLCSMLAGVALTALAALNLLAPKPHDPTPAISVLYGLLWTVVVTLPYMPLFVALSLLMVDSDEEAVS